MSSVLMQPLPCQLTNSRRFEAGPNGIKPTNSRLDQLAEDRYGYLWMVSYDGVAYTFEPRLEQFQQITSESHQVKRLTLMDDGTTWLITQQQELLIAQRDSLQQQLENLDYSENIMIKQAALLSIYTGLRRADIIYLEWKDINLRYKNKSSISPTIHKTKKAISLPLSTSATKLLRSIRKEGPRVFPGLTEYMLNKEIPLMIDKANIKKHITFHCFRHSFAMLLLNKGTDIYTIAKLMGHKSVSSTQVYAQLSDEQLRKTVLKL